MRSGGSKAKGSQFERDVCECLSLWLTAGARDDLFWRTAMSGGRASVKFNKAGENYSQVGDICALDPLGHKLTDKYVLECKHHRDLNIAASLINKTGKLYQFWMKLSEQADKVKRCPVLIARENHFPTLLLAEMEGANKLVHRPAIMAVSWGRKVVKVYKFDAVLASPCQLS